MANRRRPRALDWTSFDEFYNNFAHKEANLELLESGNPEYYQIFQSQDPEVQERILAGAVSLQEMQENQMRMSDPGFVPNQVDPVPMPMDPVSIENAAGAAEVAGEADLIDGRWDALASHVGGTRDVLGADADFTELDKLRKYETPEARAAAREELLSKRGNPQRLQALAATGDVGAGAILSELAVIEEAERVFGTPGEFDRRLQAIGSERILGQQEVRRAEKYYENTGNIGTRTVGDIASQPEMGLSVVGGLVGGAVGGPPGATVGAGIGSGPMAKMAYDSAYTEARLAGVSPEDANKFGLMMSSTEFLLEAASGKLAGGLGIKGAIKEALQKYVPEIAAKAATRAGVTGAGAAVVGYGEEFLTEALQDVASLGYAELAEDPKFQAFLRGNVSRDQWGNIDPKQLIADYNRSGMAGGGFGGAVGGAGGYVQARVNQEVRAQQAILNNTISDPGARERYARIIEQAAEATDRMEGEGGIGGKIDPFDPGSISDVIGAQYQEAGGGLSLPVSGPLTAVERGKVLQSGPRVPLEPSRKPVEATKVTPPVETAPKKKKASKKLVEAPTQSSVIGKIKDLGLESKASKAALTKTPGRKSSNVIRALSRMGTSDSEATLDLINAGKLGIVDTEADLPDGLERGRDGWYDPRSKRIWLVAGNLSPKDVRGTALHEINHFLNRNKKDKTTRTGISKLISGNLDTYNNRIKNLAKEGNSVAKEALRLAEEDGNVTEELTSYFATAALGKIAEKGVLGRAGQLFKDIKSAINTTARNKGIGELSDNDISYILRRQAEDAPSVEFTDGDKAMESIIGSRSPSYEDTVRKFPEREYKGRLDNRPRVEISDRKAIMAPIGPKIKELLERPQGMALSNILQHEDLYKAYPDSMTTRTKALGTDGKVGEFEFKYRPIADVRLRIDPDLKAGASYTASTDTISISPQLANSPRLKALVLHEIQHAIQARENFASGANTSEIYKQELKALEGVKAPEGYNGDDNQYQVQKAAERAWQRYSRSYGEAEARLSEGNLNLTDEELSSVLPEERMTEQVQNPDGTISNKRLPVDNTLPGTRPVMRAESRDLSEGLDSRAKGVSKRTVSAWDDTAASIFKMLVDPNKGIGEGGFQTREYWRLRSGEFRDKAEGYTVRINRALKKDGIDKVDFERAIAKAEMQPTYEERERSLDGLVRQYGKAAREYREGRLLIDNFSKEILREWYREITATGRKAGKKEINTMNQLAERLGQYAHRVYLATIPGMGEDYAEGILQAYDKGLTKNPYYDVVKKGIDFLVDHEVAIPDVKTMKRRATPTIRRTYQTWIGPAGALSKDEMIDALDAKRQELTPELVDRMTIKIVREMLGLEGEEEMGPISRYYRGGAIDESTLKTRKNVPLPLRALMGEVTDPAQRILITISAQADLLFKQRMLQDYYDNYEGKLWVRPGDRARPENAKFTEELEGETYGPLSGMYVTKPFAYAIRSARTQVMELKDALSMTGLDAAIPSQWLGGMIPRTLGKLSQFQKMSKTVFDFGAWSFNAMGSPINLLSKGQLLGGKHSRQALLDATILGLQAVGVEHKHNKETADRLAVLLGHGIPDSVFTAELRDSEREFYQKLLTELNRDALSGQDKTKAAITKIIRAARDNYGLADSWVKIADFYAQQEFYTEYHKVNGDTLSQEEINRKAADRVKKRNITYSRSPLVVQALERSGATVFATFASEVLRVMITTPLTIKDSLQMAKNAKTPEAKNIALMESTKTAVGYATAMALIPYLSHQLINQFFNGEDDDEKAKEERERFLKLWFETDQDQSFVVLGKNAEGGVVMLNASRIDPNGHATDFVRQAAQGDDPEEYWNSLKNLLFSPVGNGYMDDVWNALTRKGAKDSRLADHMGPVQEAFRKLYEWAPGLERDDADRVTRILDNFYPGSMRVVDRIRDQTIAPESDKTRVIEPSPGVDPDVANAWTAMGMRTTVIDPKKIAAFEVNQFNTNRARVVTLWNDLVKRDNLTYDDVARTALDIYAKEEEAAIRMIDVYDGLDTDLAGLNPRQVLKDANLNAEDINDASLGRYRSVVLSRSRMAESEKRLLSQTDDREERRRIRENFRLARQVLADLDLETR